MAAVVVAAFCLLGWAVVRLRLMSVVSSFIVQYAEVREGLRFSLNKNE